MSLNSGKGAQGRLCRQEGQGHELGPLTYNLILFQIDILQRRQGGELLEEVVELVPGQVDGLEVLQGADLIGRRCRKFPSRAEFCQVGRKSKEGEVKQPRDHSDRWLPGPGKQREQIQGSLPKGRIP